MSYITNEEEELDMNGYITKKKVMKTKKPAPRRFTADDAMEPLKMDFETYEEYLELREEVEQRIGFMRMEMYDLERRFADAQELDKDLDARHAALAHKQGEIEAWEQSVMKAKDSIDRRSQTLDQQHTALKMVADRLDAANRPALEVINDVLLQLELEVDPIQIAKAVREIGKSLDVKW